MDLDYSNEELAFRAEVSGWLANNLPADLRDKVARYEHLSRDDLLRWHRILAAKGWIAPSWPQEWGGTGWNVVQRYMGMSDELKISHTLRRLTMIAQQFGDADHHLDRFARTS